jgi:prepilin-type N-terminal cleavage/methylation domain-containing protein
MRIDLFIFRKNRITKKSKKGLTLVEIIMAAAIMGVTALVLLPRFVQESYLESNKLRAAVTELVSSIRLARQTAVTKGGHYLLYINFSNNQYAIYNNSYSVANQVGNGGTFNSAVNCSGTNQFDFYALGNAVFSGSGLRCSVKNSAYDITVDPTTGATDVEKV